MDKINRVKELVHQLNIYRDSYYNNSDSQISDYEYDTLFDELKQLESETGCIMSDSPTQTVGYEVKSVLEKHRHSHAMLSLDKTKSVSDLIKFARDRDCLLMHKLDGLTVLLTYEDGVLTLAETRGNAEEGEIITHNAKVFKNIPLTIPYKGHFEIEGEAIITYGDFEKINSKLPDDKKYKNPRNLVSGSVRQLNSSIAANRNIQFIVWKVPTDLGDTYADRFEKARKFGFDVVENIVICKYDSAKDYDRYTNELKTISIEFGIPIDGLVVTYNNIQYGESLGTTGHHPRHSIAYKFYEEETTTTLTDIEWSMGKTGDLTPVAIFDELELEGTSVSRASLHNISICKELQLGIGDEITVYKANAIIPQVRENLTKSNHLIIPSTCPVCGGITETVKDNDTEVLRCKNPICKGKLLGKLSHAVSKNALNIDGLSESTLEKFIELGWVSSIKDVYQLYTYEEKMIRLDGFGKKSTDKLLTAIENSRRTTWDRFIYALSIPLIGRTASKTIYKYFKGDYDEFMKAWSCGFGFDWTKLDDFGSAIHTSMARFYLDNAEVIKEVVYEFIFENPVSKITTGNVKDLSGKVFVITGTLIHYANRDELKEIIESMGGKVSGSISSKTNYLINNDVNSSSSKNKKAKSLGVPIISEKGFVNMLSKS